MGPCLSLSAAAIYKQAPRWQLRASLPGWRMESLATVPAPLASSQRPAGGTIPLPPHFQTVGLRPGGWGRGEACVRIWSPGTSPAAVTAGLGRGGARACHQVSSGRKAREEGFAALPERSEGPARGWRRWAGGEAAAEPEPRSALISSRISSGEGGAYLPHPLGLHGARRGVEGGGAEVCELSPPTAPGHGAN